MLEEGIGCHRAKLSGEKPPASPCQQRDIVKRDCRKPVTDQGRRHSPALLMRFEEFHPAVCKNASIRTCRLIISERSNAG